MNCGAEALSNERQADGVEFFIVKHFKMLLHPPEVVETNDLPQKGVPPERIIQDKLY